MGCLELCYTSLVTNITKKKHIPNLDEVFSRMRTNEQQLQQMCMLDPMLIQANMAKPCGNNGYISNVANTFIGSTSFPFSAYNFVSLPQTKTSYSTLPSSTSHNQIQPDQSPSNYTPTLPCSQTPKQTLPL